MSTRHYTFGDTDAAATRLRMLSELFAASTAEFLRSAVSGPPGLAVDLGCGPGHSTHLLADVLGAERTVGLDTSAQFLDRATASATERVGFAQHDVTAVPFPVGGPADVLYARFLLMHLPRPEEVLARWAAALAPGGTILVQESEAIRASHPAFDAYLDLVAGVLASNGNAIYLGPRLRALGDVAPLHLRASHVWAIAISADAVARLYSLNLRTLRDEEHVRHNVPAQDLDELARQLEELTRTSDEPGIEWTLRGLVYQLPDEPG